jgi:hypothetical protein
MPSRPYVLIALAVLSVAACDRPASVPPPASGPVAAPAPPPTQAPIPAVQKVAAPRPFQGEWNADFLACGGGANASRLVIRAERVRFYESSGPILDVAAAGPNEATFKVALNGEGETTERIYRFRLSPDGQTLTDLEAGFDRRRCP